MQAVALVTGDEVLNQFNLTIDTSDVLVYMKSQIQDWMDRNYSSLANFDKKYRAHLAAIPGPSGYCYNFNMADGSDLFYLEKYQELLWNLKSYSRFHCRLPPQFNFTRSNYFDLRIDEFERQAEDPDMPYPLSVTDYQFGYVSLVNIISHIPILQKLMNQSIHHKTFDYQGVNYLIHSPYDMLSKRLALHRTINKHSIIVYLNPKKVILDESIEVKLSL
jgi:hypothetical protein